MISIGQTVKEFMFDSSIPIRICQQMDGAKCTINRCPMIAILFVGTRTLALMITNDRGAPQGWVQDGMDRATWAALRRLFMVLLVGSTTITCTFLYGGVIAAMEPPARGHGLWLGPRRQVQGWLARSRGATGVMATCTAVASARAFQQS